MPQPPKKRVLPAIEIPAAPNGLTLGSWQDGRFTFDSPEAEAAWQRRAYAQGVHPTEWPRGRKVDAETARLVEGGMAGATPPFYRGPDDEPRFGNQHTIEPPAQRLLRQQAFAGKTLDEIATIQRTTGLLPGEGEASISTQISMPGNDNQSPLNRPDPAVVSAHSTAILDGMQRARETSPIILAQTAEANVPGKTPTPVNDATPRPLLPQGDGHGRMLANSGWPAPRDYTRAPEAVPQHLAAGVRQNGQDEWPVVPEDWVTEDRTGARHFTPQASAALDAYGEKVRAEADKFTRWNKSRNEMPDVGAFLRHYLDGRGQTMTIEPTPALLQAVNVSSASEGVDQHVLDWLTQPAKTSNPSEQLVSKIQNLKDGQSVTVASQWDGATSTSDTDVPLALGMAARTFGASPEGDALATSEAAFATLGHLQVHGNATATVTRKGGRYVATVRIEKQARDVYDYTDEDGQDATNWRLRQINESLKDGDKFDELDFARLNLLAATGRAHPFKVESTPWVETLTVQLRPLPPSGTSFAVVPGSLRQERQAPGMAGTSHP